MKHVAAQELEQLCEGLKGYWWFPGAQVCDAGAEPQVRPPLKVPQAQAYKGRVDGTGSLKGL